MVANWTIKRNNAKKKKKKKEIKKEMRNYTFAIHRK